MTMMQPPSQKLNERVFVSFGPFAVSNNAPASFGAPKFGIWNCTFKSSSQISDQTPIPQCDLLMRDERQEAASLDCVVRRLLLLAAP